MCPTVRRLIISIFYKLMNFLPELVVLKMEKEKNVSEKSRKP